MHTNWLVIMKRWARSGAWACLTTGVFVCAAQADPPTLAGRVVEVTGVAWSFDADHNEWVRVVRNQTLAEGDRVRTDPRARVSLRIGSTSVWLNDGVDVEVMQMDEAGVLLRLDKGALGLALRTPEATSEYRVQTREGILTADGMGLYRVEQLAQGTRAQVLQGRLRFESDRSGAPQRAWLRDGEQAEFWWADGPRTEHQALNKDAFTQWLLGNASVDSPEGLASQQYVSPEMTGAEDLDRNGRWEQDSEYGNVWFPTQVASGWEPYRDGRWMWTRHWGWSWVDDAPWGFAPFHYGRWVVLRGRWCWTPGHYVARPVYAPALVVWRQAPGLSINITVRQPPPRGAWSPLPAREVFVPNYRHSGDYANRVNRPHDGPPAVVVPNRPAPNAPVINSGERPWRHERNGDSQRRDPPSTVRPAPATLPVANPPIVVSPPAQPRVEQPAPGVVRPRERDWEQGREPGASRGRDNVPVPSAVQMPVPALAPVQAPAPVRRPEPTVQSPTVTMRPVSAPPAAEDKSPPHKRPEGRGRDKRDSDAER